MMRMLHSQLVCGWGSPLVSSPPGATLFRPYYTHGNIYYAYEYKKKPMPKLNVGTIDLTEDEIDWLKAIGNLSGESVRAQLRQIIKGHLIRFKPQYSKQVAYLARKYGLTFEETFRLLQTSQPPFGEVVCEAPISIFEESTDFGCEVGQIEIKEGSNDDTNKAT